MNRCSKVSVFALVLSMAAGASLVHAATDDGRRQVIADTLEALRTMAVERRRETHRYVYSVERNQCQAPLTSLKVGCLLEAAQRYCQREHGPAQSRCRLVVDAMVTNRFSEPIFLSRGERLRIMQSSQNYRSALLGELKQRYARLATGLYLQQPLGRTSSAGEQAEAIDAYCQTVAGRLSMAAGQRLA
ncbi:MAG: hypothetical protein AAGK78_10760, partial [Planctomycetota bacterium]